MPSPTYHLIVFGATSFVGQILSRYLLETFGFDGELRWAAAGRSEEKLQELKESLGEGAENLPVLQADAFDRDSLNNLCKQTRVVVSTVGPYAIYGEGMVRSCVENGRDYCDLTGEVHWMKRMIRRYEAAARKTGARIVHACGFDSIPSDLGVYYLQQRSGGKLGVPCRSVRMGVEVFEGSLSGGTYASMLNTFKDAAADPNLRQELADPYTLCGEGHGFNVPQNSRSAAEYDGEFQSWTAPFMMSGINTRVVFRSNLLTGNAYGRDFQYDEATLTGDGKKGRRRAAKAVRQSKLFMLALALPPTRWLLRKFILPKPGDGPGEDERRSGSFSFRFHGKTNDGQTIRTRVTGDMDPGYGSTAKMLGQAAACLALDEKVRENAGGFWTPAALFGERLIGRMERYSGITFKEIVS